MLLSIFMPLAIINLLQNFVPQHKQIHALAYMTFLLNVCFEGFIKLKQKKKEGIWFFVSMEKTKDLAASSKRVIY